MKVYLLTLCDYCYGEGDCIERVGLYSTQQLALEKIEKYCQQYKLKYMKSNYINVWTLLPCHVDIGRYFEIEELEVLEKIDD